MIFQNRQERRFVESMLLARAILDAPLQTVEGAQTGKEMKELVEIYVKAVFPHHDADTRRSRTELRNQLFKWVTQIDNITVEPIPDPANELRKARRMVKHNQETAIANDRLSRMVRRRLS